MADDFNMADDCLEVARWFEVGTNVEPVFDYDNGEWQWYAIEDDGDVLHIIDVIERGRWVSLRTHLESSIFRATVCVPGGPVVLQWIPWRSL